MTSPLADRGGPDNAMEQGETKGRDETTKGASHPVESSGPRNGPARVSGATGMSRPPLTRPTMREAPCRVNRGRGVLRGNGRTIQPMTGLGAARCVVFVVPSWFAIPRPKASPNPNCALTHPRNSCAIDGGGETIAWEGLETGPLHRRNAAKTCRRSQTPLKNDVQRETGSGSGADWLPRRRRTCPRRLWQPVSRDSVDRNPRSSS